MTHSIDVTGGSCVYIGNSKELMPKLLPAKRIIVITDANIEAFHSDLFADYEQILIGQGEESKCLATLDKIYRQLIDMGADRSTFILGIGGGIVTDVAGFVASTYMRGVEFGFITTTLLGSVDASVGGKNGVNVGGFKNMVGTFSQPRFVICDVKLLNTLSDREFRAGLAEVIKTAILGDKELFEILEHTSFEELRKDEELLEEVIMHSVRVKASVVAEDEREGGRRRILNLGHTIAHAIEKCTHSYNHGEAVAIGLYQITKTALTQEIISAEDGARIFALIEQYGFDTELPIEREAMLKAVEGDKKRKGSTIHLIYPTAIGSVVDKVVEYSELQSAL